MCQPAAHILLIDDVPANLSIMLDLLESEGHRVSVANSAAEGLRRAQSELPDLILLDVMMPEEDGLSVCRRLKLGETTQHIPVIFMTSLDDLQDRLAGFDAGGVDYVAKPLQLAEVLSRVRTHLELSMLRRQLAEQNQQLRQARDELERRVHARTAALQEEIEERRRAEIEVQRSSEQIHDLYNHAPCGYHSLDADGICVRVNDTQVNWLGYPRSDLVGRPLVDLLPYRSATVFRKAFALIKQRGWVQDVELQLVRRDGTFLPVLMSATAVRDADDRFVMTRSTLYDLSERKKSEELIRHMAHHDPLTGLANRTLFQQKLGHLISQARRRNESVATMFLDLDLFNQINDSFGHAVGDLVLREVSKRLSRCLRDSDALARWGGDEFVVALSAPDVHLCATQVAQNMLRELSEPVLVESHELHLSGSVGISLYPADGLDARTLLRAADTAMYHAKECARGSWKFFTPELTANVQHRTKLAALLHGAQQRNELSLAYQPQVDIDSGRIIGVEALMRWHRPDVGPISPTEFIPIAEDTGLIHQLGDWALERACEQAKRWHDGGARDLTLAVNVSVRQLVDPNIAERLISILRRTGLRASSLELEITENLLLQPTDDILRLLNDLTELGVRLTVDDFGIGYSSLSYLHRYPIKALKIDRSFISRIGVALHNDTIVEAIIALAQSLHLHVLAEGVETPSQVDFLRARGCRVAQGFFFSRPVDAARLTALLGPKGAGATARQEAALADRSPSDGVITMK